ncbi:hypothetical protein MMPV_002769 [Pyropia vietnamensis]
MAFKTIISVVAVAVALVAAAESAAAVPAGGVARQALVGGASPGVVGGNQQVVVVPGKGFTSFGNKRGDDKKVNVEINVEIEKEEENPEYGYKKGDDKEVNVKINVDVKKEKKEEKEGAVVVSGLTGIGQPQLVPTTTHATTPGVAASVAGDVPGAALTAACGSYYKRPSAAIERGGGFFIPGLRGPRLRAAVAVAIVTGLAVNHGTVGVVAAAGGESAASLARSEVLGVGGVLVVLATLVVVGGVRSTPSSAATAIAAAGSATPNGGAASSSGLPPVVEAELAWAAATLTDLTPATAVLVIAADGTPLVVTGPVDTAAITAAAAGGPVLTRVAAERRGVYVADGAALPPGVDLPFEGVANGARSWAADVLFLPRSGAVVAVGAPVVRGEGGATVAASSPSPPTFSSRDRVWAAQVAARVDEVLAEMGVGQRVRG